MRDGHGGIRDCARAGALFIDMSPIAPGVSRGPRDLLSCRGREPILDTPMSDGESKAVEGTPAIMVGGSQENPGMPCRYSWFRAPVASQ